MTYIYIHIYIYIYIYIHIYTYIYLFIHVYIQRESYVDMILWLNYKYGAVTLAVLVRPLQYTIAHPGLQG